MYDIRQLVCLKALPLGDAVEFILGQLPEGSGDPEVDWADLLAGQNRGSRSTGRRYLQARIAPAFLAFEHMVLRDWSDSLCGVCGYHPHAVVADGNAKMVMKLKGIELSVGGGRLCLLGC